MDVMQVDFNNIKAHIIPMECFSMKWRFTEEAYNILSELHLNQLKPLDKEASNFIDNFISKTDLHADVPFKRNFFRTIDYINICEGNEQEVKKWLYNRKLPFGKDVFLSWDKDTAMIAPWKLLIKYFNDYHYADDLTVIDQSLTWVLLFFHEGTIYHGTNNSLQLIEKND